MKSFAVFFAVVCAVSAQLEIAPYELSQLAAPASARIANGHPAVANQFPFQVALLTPGGGVCGGSLIASNWVLSAAHCTVGTQHSLRFGTIQRTTGGIAQTSFHRVNHPAFNPVNLNNDISVLSVPTPLTFTAAIQSIRLPTAGQVGTTWVGVQATVSGHGNLGPGTPVQALLRWVHMRPITNAACAATYGTATVVAHTICAVGYVNPANQGHCGGDSGGPLTVLEGGIRTQIGVVVFGAAAGCHLGHPSGYARTGHFTGWVNQHTGIPVRG